MAPRTLYDKIWDNHVVDDQGNDVALLYIDCHLVHEVTSPQAFEGLKLAGRKVRRPDLTIAVADHNIPTTNRAAGIEVVRRGSVRRAKLYYLRGRRGKSARTAEKTTSVGAAEDSGASESAAPAAEAASQ